MDSCVCWLADCLFFVLFHPPTATTLSHRGFFLLVFTFILDAQFLSVFLLLGCLSAAVSLFVTADRQPNRRQKKDRGKTKTAARLSRFLLLLLSSSIDGVFLSCSLVTPPSIDDHC